MVDGLHKYLDRELAASVEKRQARWEPDFASPEAYRTSVQPNRDRLAKILGVVDERVPPNLQYVEGPGQPSLVAETDRYQVRAVRWPVLPGVDAEGLLLEPNGRKAMANVVAIPDADQTPEQIVSLAKGLPNEAHYARRLAEAGCRVLVPTLIDRKDTHSGSARFNRWTNQPHRDFVHRMAFEMGRTLTGYEVQKVLAAVDWFCRDKTKSLPVGVFGYGEGGLVAMYAMALDTRITAGVFSGSFGPCEDIADEPIYRNVWGLLTEFGDGDVLRLVFPRSVVLEWSKFVVPGPPPEGSGRTGAAPGAIENASLAAAAEFMNAHNPFREQFKFPYTGSTLYAGVTVKSDQTLRHQAPIGTWNPSYSLPDAFALSMLYALKSNLSIRGPSLRIQSAADTPYLSMLLMSKYAPTVGVLNWSTYSTSCSGLVMKLFQTTSMAILTPSLSASGIAFFTSAVDRSQHWS